MAATITSALLPNSLLQLLSLTITAASCWIVGSGVYNAFIHPICRYPGPKLWAAYRIPYVYYNIRGQLPFKVLELHRRYGPVVRIGPDHIVFTDAEAWQDIYGLQPGRVQNAKDKTAYMPLLPGWEQGIIHANDTTHAHLRKMYGAAFTSKALADQAGMLQKYADLLVTQLKAAKGRDCVHDVSAWYNFTTFDLTGEFAFGETFHCLERGGEYHSFVKTIFDGVIIALQMMQLEHYKILTMLKPFLPKSAMKPKEDMDQYTRELVDRRMDRGYDPKTVDVFNYLLQQKDEMGELSRGTLYENGITLVVAGSETTATLLTGVTYFLCKNPVKLRRLQYEVRSCFKTDGEITSRSVNDLAYMNAVLSEGLRLYPPVPFGIPRLISNTEGQIIAGHHLPHKTRAAIFHHAAYRYEHNFACPDEFIPERWLPDAPPEFKSDARDVLQPFHVGPRGCIGKSLANAEMRLILAKMVWNFEMELADPAHDWYDGQKAYMLWKRGSLNVRLRAVQR